MQKFANICNVICNKYAKICKPTNKRKWESHAKICENMQAKKYKDMEVP